ncbi:uncharacterized protein LOC110705848 [Chenopodium quinoa]|uniref:uncharacterized protein LOC110705848 n=1 Tax=Chenopodium quinoa TaxID=63459 RepID=UPI000B7987B6|nr:uncharacterized protein LOC110705848 [Chenopodium quinoa]
MLVFCEEAKLLWYLSPLRLEVGKYNGSTFAEWCGGVRLIFKDHSWWNVFWSTLWGVWLRRTDWIFAGKKREITEVLHKAISIVGEFDSANDHGCSHSVSEPLECKWKSPPEGVIKVNSDAAIFKSRMVGLGGVMRDSVGDVVAATCLQVAGSFDVDVVEAMAMRHALVIAMESGFLRVCLETDNIKLHYGLSKQKEDLTAFGLITKDILKLANSCHECSFAFVKRTGNQVAHSLAKLSSKFVSLRVWLEEYPIEIHEVVMADLGLSST